MDVPGDDTTRDCGGDCLRCMAAAGDPDCQRAMHELTGEYGDEQPGSIL